MEALDFLKLHNFYSHFSTMVENSHLNHHFRSSSSDVDFFEEDDSFFDLHFISSPFSDSSRISISTDKKSENDLCFSHSDPISKRKILPIEVSSKSESPVSVSILKSAPRLSISLFKKPKLMKKEKIDETESSSNVESKRFAFKLNRIDSSRNHNHLRESSDRKSKRFSKERMQKYLKLIKPLYVKVSKRYNYRNSPEPSPATDSSTVNEKQRNISIDIRVVCRRLRKCKSSSAVVGMAAAVPNRRDDSLLQQNDGIESAILHCKRSFSSSRDACLVEDDGDGTCKLQKQKAGKDVFPEAKEREGQ